MLDVPAGTGSSIPDILHLVASELRTQDRLVADGEVLGDASRLEGPDGDALPETGAPEQIREVSADIVLDGLFVAQLLPPSDATPGDHLAVSAERLREMMALALAQRHHAGLARVLHGNLIAPVMEGQGPHQVRRLWHLAGLEPDAAAVVLVVPGFGRGPTTSTCLGACAHETGGMAHQQDARRTLLAPLSAGPSQWAALARTAATAMAGTPLFGAAVPLAWNHTRAHLSVTEAGRILRHRPQWRERLLNSMAVFIRWSMDTLSSDPVIETYARVLLGDLFYWDRMHGTDLAPTFLPSLDQGCPTVATTPGLQT